MKKTSHRIAPACPKRCSILMLALVMPLASARPALADCSEKMNQADASAHGAQTGQGSAGPEGAQVVAGATTAGLGLSCVAVSVTFPVAGAGCALVAGVAGMWTLASSVPDNLASSQESYRRKETTELRELLADIDGRGNGARFEAALAELEKFDGIQASAAHRARLLRRLRTLSQDETLCPGDFRFVRYHQVRGKIFRELKSQLAADRDRDLRVAWNRAKSSDASVEKARFVIAHPWVVGKDLIERQTAASGSAQ